MSKLNQRRLSKSHEYVVLDIGNTRTDMAVYRGSQLLALDNVDTYKPYKKSLKLIHKYKSKIKAAIICSVVPRQNKLLKKYLSSISDFPSLFLGKDIAIPIANKAQKPEEVGLDRLANAYYVFKIYQKPCICIDFGTAVTFDVISLKGAYLGGIIVPGIHLGLNALANQTALLPQVNLKHSARVVGRNTEESIQSGLNWGMGSLCDGIVAKINHERGCAHKVIATGGNAVHVAKYTESIQKIQPNFTLRAISSIYLNHLNS